VINAWGPDTLPGYFHNRVKRSACQDSPSAGKENWLSELSTRLRTAPL